MVDRFDSEAANVAVSYDIASIAEPVALTLVADRASPQPSGTAVVFTAQASGGTGPHEYKWWLFDGSNWTSTGGWSTRNRMNWTAGTKGVPYRISVWARSAGSSVDTNALDRTLSFTVSSVVPSGPPSVGLQLTSLTTNVAAPQAPGTPITFTATATGGTAPYQYKWWVFDGGNYQLARDWSASPSFAWTPTTANAAYRVGVWVRSAGSAVDSYDNGGANGTTAFPIQ